MADLIQHAGTALITISALLAVGCVVVHSALARWWKTAAGRHAFSFEAVLALSLTLWVVRLALPNWEWFTLLRLAAFALVPVVLAWRLVIIVQVWRRSHQRKGAS
ncbi:putative phage holin [Nonomuraea rhodomycinica]|uniref:Uncharacterized protein n=1 Tax=Nonomuraea rhodomycinica TaxID=1712872 RepID=A0A7Y6IWV0_9ACTN|nr:hypothetical protein [Nonomuraea rhodomycinica]NUW45531.1 hypothetical protein [Nonomuraea rhodomycinica]